MRYGASLVPRRAASQISEALADTRVVIINGARQVGKSTLAEVALRTWSNGTARFLDDGPTREAAQEDPIAFLRHGGLMLIDEVQRVPDLWLAIKHDVDRDPGPGRFLLTGSARLNALQSLPDSLVGRSQTIELWPLSQGEIDNAPDGFIDAAFAHGADLRMDEGRLLKRDYLDRVMRGGYPEVVRRKSPARRRQFFESYLSDLIVRDIQQVANLHRVREIRQLLSLLAAQVCGILNVSRIAGALELDARTVSHYIDILETIFVIRRVPGWAAGPGSRTVAKPKLCFTDSGLASFLCGTLVGQPAVTGGLLENFVLSELGRQLTWAGTYAQLFHYRDHEQYEVDAVIEANGGQIIGIEVKAAETVRSDDFRCLRRLRDRVGQRFHAGFVLHCGVQSLSFGESLAALPVSALWELGSGSPSDEAG